MQELLALADDETRALWDGLVLGYTETLGSPLLRQEIAGLYETLEADDVIAVVGASEALFVLFSALVRPGDHVVALWPAYQSLYDLARAQGADVELSSCGPRTAGRSTSTASPRPCGRRRAPSSSTSRTTRPACTSAAAEFDALAEIVERHGATLVCDEVYRGLEQDPARSPAGGGRPLAPRRQRRRALEVVRAGRPARGLAGDARPRPARRRRAGPRLHLALQPGARPRCSASSRCAPRMR